MSRIKYDRVYVWQDEEWREIVVNSPAHLNAVQAQLDLRGLISHPGLSTIGPPEGPPR
jgi:hypothetical protein